MRMKRPQGYKTKRCKHGNKVRFHFRTLHRLKLEIEWPECCDPKGVVHASNETHDGGWT